MGEFTLDATTATPITIRTKSSDGTINEHHFESLPFNKPRYDAYMGYAKKVRALQARLESDDATIEDQIEMADALAAALDERVRSTNGPVTIKGLWDDGLIPIPILRQLGEKLNEELADPPA